MMVPSLSQSHGFEVCVNCLTFNHAPYVLETLKGFVMQNTTFPFVCVIIDDASTDGEQRVITSFIENEFVIRKGSGIQEETEDYRFIFASHKDNLMCSFAVYLLKYNHHEAHKTKSTYFSVWNKNAKYQAICEGDDYWVHPLKLQMQFDFLESNNHYSCCYTSYMVYDNEKKKPIGIFGTEYHSIRQMLWEDVSIATASLFFRSAFYEDYISEIGLPSSHGWLMGDKPLFLYLGHKGFTRLLRPVTTVYRLLKSSASHSNDISLQLKRARNTIDIYHFFANKYFPNDDELTRKIEGGYLYRAYYFYKAFHQPYPNDLKKSILYYRGKYLKLYAVKLMLCFPFLEKIVYTATELKNKLMLKVKQLQRYV